MAAPRFGVAHTLGRTFAIWLRNLLPFTVLTLIIYSPRLVFAFASRSRPFEVAELLTFLLIDPFLHTVVAGALIFGVLERLRGRAAGIGACLGVTLSRILPVLGVALCVHLVALAATVPVLLLAGLLDTPWFLLLGLGCWLAVQARYWMAVPVAVVERPGTFASLRRSAELTADAWGRILAILLFFYGTRYAVLFLIVAKAGTPFAVATGWLLLNIVHAMLFAVANAVTYHDLKVGKEGATTDDLVKVFA